MLKSKWVTYPKRENCLSFLKDYHFDKPVKDIEISITSMGWYHLYNNNKRIDTDVFSPGFTYFKKRVQYQTYKLKPNQNIKLKVDLAEGWSGGDRFAWAGGRYFNFFPMSLNYEMRVNFKDGETKKYYSDSSLKVYTNKYIDSTIYYGEKVDFRRKPKFIGYAKKINIDTKLIPQEGCPIIYGERFKAAMMKKDPKGNMLIDFKQNFTGAIEIKIKGKKGDVISYTPCEILDKDGCFYNDNYRKCKDSIYSFVLSGKEETLIPDFSFLGGRYIKLIEYPSYIKKENFTGVSIHSKLEETSYFESGNPKINRFYLNTKYGQLSNYLDIPTDCPQRDERLGWTGDAQVFAKTAAIHFNVHQFFKKYINELIVSQYEDGSVDGIVPMIMGGRLISSGWGDVSCVIPYETYMSFDDKKILKESIPMMKKWVSFYQKHYKEDKPYIVDLKSGFGDWLALDKKEDLVGHDYRGLTDFSLIDTAFFAYSTSILIKSLKALNQDSTSYEELLENIKVAYSNEFIYKHHMKGKKALLFFSMDERTCYTQTGLVLSLYFDLCKKEDRPYLIKDLVDLISECGDKLTTGFLGTPYLLYALSENKEYKKAYDLLFQEEFPSWLYSVNKGATTVWEHYDGIKEDGSICDPDMNSFNHYAYGSTFSFIFEVAAGIKRIKPSYKEVLIEPIIDERFGYINASYKSKYGLIKSYWKINKNSVTYEIDIPKGIKATIRINNEDEVLLDGGHFKKVVRK